MKKSYPISEPEEHFVNESPTQYITAGGTLSLSDLTPIQKMEIGKRGITKQYLEQFKKAASLGYTELADALSVTRATLLNKKGMEKFSGPISERIISLADLYAYGYAIFEDHDNFNRWMQTQNQALAGLSPLNITDSIYGREEVKNLIGRIAYGVYS